MTPQEINIEIAKDLGWTQKSGFTIKGRLKSIYNWIRGEERLFEPPNFHDSLDAMHKAKKSIMDSPTLRVLFINTLRTVVGRRIHNPSDLDLVNAESREECETFLRTVGKWKD